MSQSQPPAPFVVPSDEGDPFWFVGNLVTVKAGSQDTGGRVTVVEFVNPPGFAPPLHRHLEEDEMFWVLAGKATWYCGGKVLTTKPGDFLLLPMGLPHTFVVGPDEPLRTVQITARAGFERYVAAAGTPASERVLPQPDPSPIDPVALAHVAALHGIEILGPPPTAER